MYALVSNEGVPVIGDEPDEVITFTTEAEALDYMELMNLAGYLVVDWTPDRVREYVSSLPADVVNENDSPLH